MENTQNDLNGCTEENFAVELVPGSIKKHLSSKNGVASGDLFKIPRHMIKKLPGYNVRETRSPSYLQRVEEIAQSMTNNGWLVTEPISGFVAREGENEVFYLVKGHTRLDAFDLAVSRDVKLGDIPAIPQPRGTSMRDLNNDLVLSNSGTRLSLLELGTVCQRKLRNEGLSVAEVATDLGLKPKQVEDAVLLRTSPKGVQELLIMEKVSSTVALTALRKHGSEALKVLEAGLTRAESLGKTKATPKHFVAPSWNRRVVERGLTEFRAAQRERGYKDADLLPEDPLEALRLLLGKAYPDLADHANVMAASKDAAKDAKSPAPAAAEI